MAKPVEISASLLSSDFGHLARDIRRCEEAGVDRFHIDCMDGHFVPNLTVGPAIVEAVRKCTKLPLECHLMIEHPGVYVESYSKAGADILMVQAECYGERRSSSKPWNQWPKEIDRLDVPALRADLKKIRQWGRKAFAVFNPGTPLNEDILPDCDGVLIMSVNPGFAGQTFMTGVLPKLSRLKEIFKGDIAVDGGINGQTAPAAIQAGARDLITASYLFGAKDLSAVIKNLRAFAKP